MSSAATSHAAGSRRCGRSGRARIRRSCQKATATQTCCATARGLARAEERRSENGRTKEQMEDYALKANNELFVLVTDMMIRTNPGMRDEL